jgi:metallo-beta-lactamase class B
VKILLSGHAHFDHVQGHAEMQRATGAQVMALGDDAIALETGRDRSPLAAEGWAPVHVDRVLHDGDTVSLGGTTLRAVWAPGHTPGCTVWTTEIVDRDHHDRRYQVAFDACLGPNDGVPLIDNPRFPNLVADTLAAFHRLDQLSPDLWLLMHPAEQFAGKLDALRAGADPNPLYDPAGWHTLQRDAEADFRARVQKEQLAR